VRLYLALILLAVALQGSFPARTPQTFRTRYGKPLSETFLVRPGVVVSAVYGASGDTCELVIVPKDPKVIFTAPTSRSIDNKLLETIEDELVPEVERGKFKITNIHDTTCPPENDCSGIEYDWENVVIYQNDGEAGSRYGVIRWNRQECGKRLAFP
jgi:hypothetical protein